MVLQHEQATNVLMTELGNECGDRKRDRKELAAHQVAQIAQLIEDREEQKQRHSEHVVSTMDRIKSLERENQRLIDEQTELKQQAPGQADLQQLTDMMADLQQQLVAK